MKRLVIISLLPLAAVLSVTNAACSSKPKKNPHIATQVEENFKQRWIAKRMGELQANKHAADAREARRMATEEFKQKFAATTVAQEPDATSGLTQ